MLKKLFKYDFLAITKSMWLFTAIAILITAAVCGISVFTHNVEAENFPEEVQALMIMVVVFSVIISIYAIVAYYILAIIMVLMRYYKNLFTDEGYLTFTLPVRVTDILNSKFLSGALWLGIATVVEFGCIWCIVLFWMYNGDVKSFIDYSVGGGGGSFLFGGFDTLMFDYGMEAWESFLCTVFDGIVILVFNVLLLYLSITFATIIAKRARVVLGIVFHFGITLGLSLVMMLVLALAAAVLYNDDPIISDQGFAYLRYAIRYVFYGGAAAGAYFLNRHLLKTKLNLL